MTSILRFVGLSERQPGLPDVSGQVAGKATVTGLPATGSAAEQYIPVELLPAPLLERINDLQAALGYPALVRDTGPQAPAARRSLSWVIPESKGLSIQAAGGILTYGSV